MPEPQARKGYREIKTIRDYTALFKPSKTEDVLKHILDIRKFEIELYWKRTAFFWTIIAAVIAGYFLVYARMPQGSERTVKVLYSLACLGLIFSVGWYFVNRGSKFWQVNWEKHLDCLEDEVIGPLYKTTIDPAYYHGKFFSLLAPYPFSVSKINQVLNIVLIGFWVSILTDLFRGELELALFSAGAYLTYYTITGLLTLISVFCLFIYTHSEIDSYFSDKSQRRETGVNFIKRGLHGDPPDGDGFPDTDISATNRERTL